MGVATTLESHKPVQIVVFGLWHLGCVTAACLAGAGRRVIGLDLDESQVAMLQHGQAPVLEPGLPELLAAGLANGNLAFTSDPNHALQQADILWVTYDTPVNEQDIADIQYVRTQLERIADAIQPGTLVLISAQLPVGFTRELERDWHMRGLRYACSPENLRLGNALESFRKPERVIIGIRADADRPHLAALFAPFCDRIVWMSIESAEMTKHALNAWLATSVAFINELARLCETTGADAKEVEQGLKSEERIGQRAYLAPGAAFAGGTLARDLGYLVAFGQRDHVATPLFQGVQASNEGHKNWLHAALAQGLKGLANPTVAVLGLTYKPHTSTLRRSMSIELCRWLHHRGVAVQAHDPAIHELPDELQPLMTLCPTATEALAGADLAIIATPWPEYRSLEADRIVQIMRRPQVIDQNHFLAGLASDARIGYRATGTLPAASIIINS